MAIHTLFMYFSTLWIDEERSTLQSSQIDSVSHSLSAFCLWRHYRLCNALRDILWRVCLMSSQLSWSYTFWMYGIVCSQLVHPPFDGREDVFVLYVDVKMKLHVWTTSLSGCAEETTVSVVCSCSSGNVFCWCFLISTTFSNKYITQPGLDKNICELISSLHTEVNSMPVCTVYLPTSKWLLCFN